MYNNFIDEKSIRFYNQRFIARLKSSKKAFYISIEKL